MNRNGEVAIVDSPEPGRERERERYPVVYGAKLKKKDGPHLNPVNSATLVFTDNTILSNIY